MTARWAYLGPAGTFTEQALDLLLARPRRPGAGRDGAAAGGAEVPDRLPCPSVVAALDAVRAGEVDAAVVPIENSVEGGVSATLDALAAGERLVIVGEVLVPVVFVLAAAPGTALGAVRVVGSHPHALAQCRGWLAEHLPGATTTATASTAAAASALAVTGEGAPSSLGTAPRDRALPRTVAHDTVLHDAALCAAPAAAAAGLEVLAPSVADRTGAITRFVAVARPGAVPPRSGADKTTVVAYQRQDTTGSLLALLEQFAARGVNLCRIDSRPVGTALGRYCFSIDCEGHVDDPRVGEALAGLRRTTADLRFLGSYPRADGVAPVVPQGTADADFTAAQTWLVEQRGR